MLCKFTRVLKRLWPTLLVFIVSLFTLAYLISPQPREILRFTGDANVYPDMCMVSPDDHYLVTVNGEMNLIDLNSQQSLLSIPQTNDQFGFDEQGRFVWLELKKLDFMLEEGVLISLWRYDPRTHIKHKLIERLTRIMEGNGGIYDFKGLHRLGLHREFALLSPNCSTLLVPHYTYSESSFELIDVGAGLSSATLDLPSIQNNATYTLLVEAEFSPDGRSLLIQTEDRMRDNTHYRLRLFDTKSCKETASLRLPGTETLGAGSSSWHSGYHDFDRTSSLWQNKTRLGKVIQFEHEHVVAIWTHVEDNYDDGKQGAMFVDFKSGTVRKIPLDELQLTEQEQQLHGKKKEKQVYPEIESYRIHPGSTLMSIARYQESTHYVRRQGDRYLPLLGFSTRNLQDGSLLHSSRFTFPGLDHETLLEQNELVAILPANRVLMKQTNSLLAGKSILKEWLEKIKGWLNISSTWHLYVINTETGIADARLSLSHQVKSAHLLSDGRTLALMGNDHDGQFFLMKYDYPLHIPWLLIISWSVGLAAAMFVFSEFLRASSRRRQSVKR